MLHLTLANDRQRRQIVHEGGPLEFGRLPKPGCEQIVVDDPYTSREQLRLEELPSGDVRITNLGSPIVLSDGTKLPSGQERTFIAPLRIGFGTTTLEIGVVPRDDAFASSMHTIARPMMSAGSTPALTAPTSLSVSADQAPSAETLTRWFETLLGVQKAAAGSQEFYADTARAVVQLVGLDRGLVLLKQGDDWQPVASYSIKSGDQRQFSRRVLAQVATQQRTYFQKLDANTLIQSLANIEAVVASPIFDERGNVAGVVYGSRDANSTATQHGIQPLEAQFVQLLAGAVSTGLARLASEAEAARNRVQFEQFFSPELAGALARDPHVLAAQDKELTLLFADLRGFSRVAERIGAGETYNLLSDILDRLTNQVMDHGGVVIDYYGDGLAAMWNAPAEQSQHADLAAQAAQAMLAELVPLNEQWEDKLGTRLRLGVGLHTGSAQVGNAGSRRRLKYGPRGHTVNLVSRIEAATKVVRVACLVSATTNAALTLPIQRRRVCRAQLTGMMEPVDLFELPAAEGDATWSARCERYEAALAAWEQDRPDVCLQLCRQVQQEFGKDDGPVEWLAAKAQERVSDASSQFQSVFAVETK
jgi:adenylate cyclase